MCEHPAWLFLCYCCTALHARSHLARDNLPHSTPERYTLGTRYTPPCHTGRNTRSFLSRQMKGSVSFKIRQQQRAYFIQGSFTTTCFAILERRILYFQESGNLLNLDNDVLFKVTQVHSEKGNPSAPIRSRTSLAITSSDALPLSYRRLVVAKAMP